MSRKTHSAALKRQADIFAALGDETRLSLVRRLGDGERRSISELAEGAKISRQAITKHLHVLEEVGLVHNVRFGRESLFELHPEPLDEVREALESVAKQWDETLGRLKAFVEGE